MEKTFYISHAGGKDFEHITLDILSERIYMNEGIALMPFMNEKYYFVDIVLRSGFNEVETNFVEYLYRLRKANREKKKVEYTTFSGPNENHPRDRVFIGGKIFPILNIFYSSSFESTMGIGGSAADLTKIEKRNITSYELRLLMGETFQEYAQYSNTYISIDNDKIRIYLPKYSDINIDYAEVMYDFLTNGQMTMLAATHGEFPNMDMYEIATGKKKLQEGCWLKKDRKDNTNTWRFACMDVIKNKWQGIFGPFEQIYSFYNFVDEMVIKYKHKCRWTKGARKLVKALTQLEGGSMFIYDDVEVILSELNLGICDFAVTQFYELFYGKYSSNPLDTLQKGYEFDKAFVTYEQQVVAVPIYKKASTKTIERYQDMADKDAKGQHGTGSWAMDAVVRNKVIPEFDEPWNAKVTDAVFRTDLPLLMLWLDRHKPTALPFKGKTDKNGYLKAEYKAIIKKYEVK